MARNQKASRPAAKPKGRAYKTPVRAKSRPTPAPAAGSKLDHLVALLGRKTGASIAEMIDATGWQAHSIRGALAGALKKRGLAISSDKTDGERRYRIDA